jgi:hypothetical protein
MHVRFVGYNIISFHDEPFIASRLVGNFILHSYKVTGNHVIWRDPTLRDM